MDATAARGNYGLREEIQAFWSERAAGFDDVPGHEILSERERRAWHDLFSRHLGPAGGRTVLDLASGTGVISHLLDDLGFRVTGLDWSEAMLERARTKAAQRGRQITFRLGDAERIVEDDGSFDVLVTRHLVWTLVDPPACFAEWLRILKPGGTLLVVDGDFVHQGAIERLFTKLEAAMRRLGLHDQPRTAMPPDLAERHRSIVSRVYFSRGAQAEAICELLEAAGFSDITVDRRLNAIHRAQASHMPLLKGLARQVQHRYAIRAGKAAS